MSLNFNRQVIKNPQGQIKYRILHSGGREHYHVGIWLEGPEDELDKVEKVEHELHPTFRNRIRSSSNRNNKFSITIWTWGMFAVKATIHFKDGSTEEKSYYLSYELPLDDGTNYIQVQND